jgi:ligand-binding sensor domain-containing protein
VSSICFDGEQNVWLATVEGRLYHYDPSRKTLTDKSALLSGVATLKAIYKISWQAGELFVGTDAGLVIIKAGEKTRVFALENPDKALNEVRGVLPDGPYVWICNNRLLARLHTVTGKLTLLGEREGLANVQLFPGTLAKSPKGTLLIGSNKGFYEASGDKIKIMFNLQKHF